MSRGYLTMPNRSIAVLMGLAIVLSLLVTPSVSVPVARADSLPAPASGLPATVTADPLPTVQINGIVWATATVGNTVYATGVFNYARPAGQALSPTHQGETAVGNIVAFDITTGKMDTKFIHTLDGSGRSIAASPDGKRIYVGGGFTKVDNATHNHIVAFNTATGAVDKTFQASVGSTVVAIAPTNGVVYVGGSFTSAGGLDRSNLAAFDALGRLTSWKPLTAGGFVESMVLAPDKSRVIIGGHFSYLNGVPARGSGSLNASTGATMPWALNSRLFDYDAHGYIRGLTTDGKQIYGAGVAASGDPNNFEGRFAADPNTGTIIWANTCYGDSYATQPIGQVLYSTSHDHYCGSVGSFPESTPSYEPWHRTMAETTFPNGGVNTYGGRNAQWTVPVGLPTAQILDWFPGLTPAPKYPSQAPPGTLDVSGAQEAGWALTTNAAGSYLVVGGEFLRADNKTQQGLVRYALRSVAPKKSGPVTVAGLASLTVVPGTSGRAYLSWYATWDRDNEMLTYQVYRDSGTAPIYSTTVPSTFWQTPRLNFTDSGLKAGAHTYRLRVVDPDGNGYSSTTPVTIANGAPGVAPVPSDNLALEKPTSSSGLWAAGYEPRNAVDNNTTSLMVTRIAQSSWWQVDLGSIRPVNNINIWGRTNCCLNESSAYYVFASNTPFDQRLSPKQQATQKGVFAYLQAGYSSFQSVKLPTGATARYFVTRADTGKSVTNTAIAMGTDVDGRPVSSLESSVAVAVMRAHRQSPGLAFTGGDSQLALILASTLVAVGGLFFVGSRSRRRAR